MEAIMLKRIAERSELTHLLNEIKATLFQETVTKEKPCILNEHLNQLESDGLRHRSAATTSAKLKCRIRQFQESHNRPLPATPTETVQRARQPAVKFPKIDLMKFDGQPSLRTRFWA
ncbi:hypothetical protein MTO96_020518 [Rhipicephalus appendiculatus]